MAHSEVYTLMIKDICILSNTNSGLTDTKASIDSALSKHKISAYYIELNDSLQSSFDKAYQQGYRTFVAAGGDGTVNALASLLVNKMDVVMGVIPSGTLNHFAKDLGLAVEIDESVSRLAKGRSKLIDVGHINDKIFLNNSSIGIYAKVANVKRRTKVWLFRFILGILSGLWFIANPPSYNFKIKVGGKTIQRNISIIFVGNNRYDLSGFGLSNRHSLSGGNLSIYVIRTINPFRLIAVSLNLLIGHINADYFETYEAPELKINTRKKKLLVAYDGEVARLKTPILYSIAKKELRVIV
jgi:diacylglycerol kinase family enzyme